MTYRFIGVHITHNKFILAWQQCRTQSTCKLMNTDNVAKTVTKLTFKSTSNALDTQWLNCTKL